MAYKGKTIHNSKTGQSITFLQTKADSKGQLLEMRSTYASRSVEPAMHYHPNQDEKFIVERGQLTVKTNDRVHVYYKGDTIDIPRNTSHAMWNNTNEPTVINWKVLPALDTEYLLENATGIANDYKTKENGMPALIDIALIAQKHAKEFRLTKPSVIVQKIVFSILSPVAKLMGKKASYEKYVD